MTPMLPTRNHARRTGGTLMQILSCLVAMSAGVWLGAEYLGVKVNDLAYTALDEAKLLEQMPDQWRPNKPGAPDGIELTEEQKAEKLRQELSHLRDEAVALRKAAAGNVQALETVLSAAALENNKHRRDRTISYWERLCEVAKGVTYLHDEVAVSGDTKTTGHVLDLRRRAFEYGERAIAAIPYASVDEQAVNSGQRLARWYANGADMYREATELWNGRLNDAPGTLDQASLNAAQQQHRKEARLIHERASRVSEVLSRRYVVELPELGV